MRVQDIISLGGRYLGLGIIVALLVTVVFLGGYMLSKRKKNGETKLNVTRLALYAVFTCYLIVVIGATMLSRGDSWQNSTIQPLFYSYRSAWNSFSITEWRNIILNILMFVPFGFLLPLLSKWFQEFLKTYLAGFAFTLFIEVVQFVLRRGIFEFDDLLNNTVGAMIGYGCYRMVMLVVKLVKKQKTKIVPVICYQLPAILTVVVFSIIFSVYANQELGNLGSSYISRLNHVQVETDVELSPKERKIMVYQTSIADEAGTRQIAKEMFARFGLGIDENRTDIYEDEAIYYSDDGNSKNMWITYIGKTFRYTDFDAAFDEEKKEKTDASEDEIRLALEKIGLKLSEGAVFKQYNKEYQFTVDQIVDGSNMYDGTITCDYTEDGLITHLNYDVIEFQKYKEFAVISEQEAYERMEKGMFQYHQSNEEYIIKVLDVELDYEMDTKGFYQPVYVFETMLGGEETTINIPAVK